jgi:hypothetical protein
MGKVPQAPLISLVVDTLCAVGFYSGPTGRTAPKAQLTLEARRPFSLPHPGKDLWLSLGRSPRRAAAQPARRHQRRQRPWHALGCASARASPFLSPARKSHGPKACCPGKAPRARRGAARLRWPPLVAKAWPWRAWVRPASPRIHQHLLQESTAQRPVHSTATRTSATARPEEAWRRWDPLHTGQAGSLASTWQRRLDTARAWRWGAPAPPPCPL